MKLYKIIGLVLIFGCSPKVSEHFKHNRYVKDFDMHIINDSLQLYYKTPADIEYITDKKELRKALRKQKLRLEEDVLIYGKTDFPPYEYLVTTGSKSSFEKPAQAVTFDTLLHNRAIRFIGYPLAKGAISSLEADLESMFQSLEVGPGYRKEISSVMNVVKRYRDSNKFYAALNEVKNYPAYDKQEEWAKFQMESTFASFLGDNEHYNNLRTELESKFEANDSISNIISRHTISNAEAIARLVMEAKKHQLMLINENHFYPNHRVLLIELLPYLKDIGYTHLALEALGAGQDSLLNLSDGFPTLETGFYTREQNYGNLLRKAKALGFTFVAYENTVNDTDREVAQAENLYNKTFRINPKVKVVGLVGIDHLLEKQTKAGKKWMATELKERYNISPLTVSQTHLNSYRKQSPYDYSLIDSKNFDNLRFSSVDFHLLNNKGLSQSGWEATFHYKNNSDFDVQVALFYEDEMETEFDYYRNVPYYTTILKTGKKYELPFQGDKSIYLYTFDENGKKVDMQKITPTDDKK
ncbi:hypothetical protein [Pontibacter pamirensis]|uniref:hypothetical protein n=1 Tax=Pontibacter pamirensis TaxID=2562824 RepID=UPI001389983E|nr:hypothetical protein [Pontibacter pamirensis]